MKFSFTRHIFPIAGIVLAVYLGIILVQTVKRNYDLKNQITLLEKHVADLQAEQDDLKYKVQYYQTDSYKEKEARANLGLQAPGEGVIYLPKPAQASDTTVPTTKSNKSNPSQWWQFLFG